MPNFGAINHHGNLGGSRVSLYPQGLNDQNVINAMKRGNRREQTRSLPNMFNVVNYRNLSIRRVA